MSWLPGPWAQRYTQLAPGENVSCTRPVKASPSTTSLVIVIVVLVLASVLIREGRPVAVILQVLAGAGLIATEVARRTAEVEG